MLTPPGVIAGEIRPDEKWAIQLGQFRRGPSMSTPTHLHTLMTFEGRPDRDRSSDTFVTWGSCQLGSGPAFGALRCRTPCAPTVAACAVCGGRAILPPGPSSTSPPAVWTTIWSRTQYSTIS
jgi:hypothetical protein